MRLSRPGGRKRGTRFGSSRDTSRFGDPGSDRASHSLLRVALEAYAEERGAARADQGGVRGRVRAGCAGKGLRGGGREGAQGAPRASRAPGRAALRGKKGTLRGAVERGRARLRR